MSPTLTLADALAEIAAAQRNDAGHTTTEWAKQMQWGEDKTRDTIKKLIEAGKMAHGKAPRVNMKGQTIAADVYRILS